MFELSLRLFPLIEIALNAGLSLLVWVVSSGYSESDAAAFENGNFLTSF